MNLRILNPPILNETIHDEAPHTESPPIPNETIHDETPPASPRNIQAFQERETIKHDTMGQDMTDIVPDPEHEVSSSANFQGIFLSRMEEFGETLKYHSNITQKSWKRGLDNINRIYKKKWDNLPTKDAHTCLPIGIKVISKRKLKMSAWLEDLEMAGLDFSKPTETEAFFHNKIWNIKLMKESPKPPDNLPKSEHSFFKMVQSLIYPASPVKHFWGNVMFESISLVSYNVIAPKPYVALTSNLTGPLGLKQAGVEYLASCLSKPKQRATQLSIEGGGADNEISTKLDTKLEDLMDTVIHLMIAYNMGSAAGCILHLPFTTVSEVKVNQWDELSHFLFRKERFTDLIATNGALLEGFMFAIGWRKCSTKNEKFCLYGSLGKIENAKDEWRNQGANLSSVGCILGQSLQYVGDNLFEKIQNCYKSLRVPSFDQVNYEADIPANQGAFEFASKLTFTIN
ncbi:hypothetical protein O181_079539 [Austropuccinia psidii MF-1]|uniref:Tet-like 2OG-Fe(II) oxygenase domain-containing protein n=1 Tax=Austropuccinia psidii MF-1 TaxID=1389203 RepID=A0A9Q3FJ34_9BASI|nr:hypothetical protein [Austropuccinia psidii MF-1]